MPNIYLFGGPNGAGKTTAALQVLPVLGCRHFVNADLIAQGLSPLNVEKAALQAGQLLMNQLKELVIQRLDCGTESTLAARSLAPKIKCWREEGYQFHLFYIWLPSPEVAIERVKVRVRAGGHNIPEETVRRRYEAGRKNFLEIYQPLADFWQVLDNSGSSYRVIAKGTPTEKQIIVPEVWNVITTG